MERPDKKWRVGLVGTGYWSTKHLQAWDRIPDVEIAALCDRSREKLVCQARKFGVSDDHLYSSVEDMLYKADIDVVDLATGSESHLSLVKQATEAGKHIMCQKPFAPSLEDAQEMVHAAAQAAVRLMVTENWRWLRPFRLTKELLEQGAVGRPYAAKYSHTQYYTPKMAPGVELPQPFFREMPRLLFYEMGTHWFDVWRFLFGTPKRLYAEFARVSPYVAGEDSGIVTLGNDNFHGLMDMSWAARRKAENHPDGKVSPNPCEQMIIDGREATLEVNLDGKITLFDKDSRKETIVARNSKRDPEESHFRLQSHFVRCLESGEQFETSGEDNLLTLKMVFAAYESASRHEPVLLDEE